MKKVVVLGDGAWGTAVATLLADNGYNVTLWCYDAAVADAIATTRYNERYLPGIRLDEKISPTTDLGKALSGAAWVFEAIPIKYLRSILEQAKPWYTNDQIWVILSKGIEQDTLQLPSQILDQVFERTVHTAVFSGPSFAHDLVRKQVTAVTVAAIDCAHAQALQALLANAYFRPYLSLDYIGVQVGGAVKNVIALGVGILDGAGYTDNAKAFFMTRGLDEMLTISKALGANPQTVYGLSGIGDLVLTAMGKHSRNVGLGRRIGQGETLASLVQELGAMPEGINTVIAMQQLRKKHDLDLPLCTEVYNVICEGKKVSAMLDTLMARPLEQEC